MSYESAGRQRKADTLVVDLAAHNFTAADVLAFDEVQRAEACASAGVKAASPETWALVVASLADTAKIDRQNAAIAQPTDLLADVPGGPRDR